MLKTTMEAMGLPFETPWEKARACALGAAVLALAVTIRLFLVAWMGDVVLGDPAARDMLGAVSPLLAVLALGVAALTALTVTARD